MDIQTYTEYECSNPVTGEVFMTRDHFEAVSYFEEDWLVFERHVTVTSPSPFVSTREEVTLLWNNNPFFTP